MALRDYLALARPSNLPTVWTNVLAGSALAAPGALEPGRTALVALGGSLLYSAGMVLNDAFDRAIDAKERPERPIPSGRVAASTAFALGAALLVLGLGVTIGAALLGRDTTPWPAVITAVVLAAAIVLYDLWHKSNPVAPFVMGACRALLYLTAGLVALGPGTLSDGTLSHETLSHGTGIPGAVDAELALGLFPPDLVRGAVVVFAWVIGLSFVARQENLASPRGVWPLAFLAAPFVATFTEVVPRGSFALLTWVGLLFWAGSAVLALVRKEAGAIGRAVVALLTGISLVDAVLLATEGHKLLALLAIAGFGATLALQRWIRGT
ncbi:UbiA family prenyltransferase [Myxococcota bacterium]|nr:UbiA family prenyltransferase [Myxococcota bacterium]